MSDTSTTPAQHDQSPLSRVPQNAGANTDSTDVRVQANAPTVQTHATTGLAVQWLTCGLGLLSALLLEVAAGSGPDDIPNIAGSLAVQAVLVLGAFLIFRRRAGRGLPAPLSLVPILCGVAALPFVAELVGRHFFDRGWTLELTLLSFLRNLVLGCCAASVWTKFQQLGASLSVLLAMFAVSFGHDRALVALLSVYVIAGVWWLTGSYWDNVRGHITAESEQSLPRRWFFILPGGIVLLAMLMFGVGRGSATTALRGFMPTSGGTQWQDDFANGGVNDGEALVAAQNEASSFGPVETDVFMDSKQSSLYDAFDDQYDSPLIKSETQRAISLPPGLMKETHQQMAAAKKAHREFSTVRQQIHQHRHQHDVETDALFFVSGRTPLHLRLEEYDLFDGLDWYPAAEPRWKAEPSFRKREGKPWLQLDTNSTHDDLFAETESHSLKTVSLEGNHIPLPLHATELHIDKVDRPDLFAWVRDSILRLQRKTIPAQLVVHTRSRVLDPETIATWESQSFLKSSANRTQTTNPTDFATVQVEKLAARWADGLVRGWPQINSITSKLRTEYVHDRKHQVGSNSVNPTAQFVLSDRRGPDFLFASAAAVMLRSLDYPTRLVSGFYASPENYDRTTGHTAVLPEDVHFWCEVYVGANTWLPLEPTPGYEILLPRLSLTQWLGMQFQIIIEWASQRWPLLVATVVLLLAGWKIGVWQSLRDRLWDATWMLQWRLSMRGNGFARQNIQVTRRLVLRRCRLTGWVRLPGESDHRYLRRVFAAVDGPKLDPEQLGAWLRLLDWDRFSPPDMTLSAAGPGINRLLLPLRRDLTGEHTDSTDGSSVVEDCCRYLACCLTVTAFRAAGNADAASLPFSVHQSPVTNPPVIGDQLNGHQINDSRSSIGSVLSAG
jgi:protein-glutamine gamma-glutamyltransferase